MLAKKVVDPRRGSRVFALQVLYEADVAGHATEAAVSWLKEENPLSEESLKLAMELINGIGKHQEALDELIQKLAPAWPVSYLSAIDRNILRLALYEVGFKSDVPRKSAINEAVELAKSFGSDGSSRFVNGVLGSMMQELEAGT